MTATPPNATTATEESPSTVASRYQQLRSHLAELKLTAAAEALAALLDQAAAEGLSLTVALERLLAVEVDASTARRLAGRLRFACLPTPATLDDFDVDSAAGIDRTAMMTFAPAFASTRAVSAPKPVRPSYSLSHAIGVTFRMSIIPFVRSSSAPGELEMPIQVACPACTSGFKLAEEHAGRRVKCPKCRASTGDEPSAREPWVTNSQPSSNAGSVIKSRRIIRRRRLGLITGTQSARRA